jgi:hypothetical protein
MHVNKIVRAEPKQPVSMSDLASRARISNERGPIRSRNNWKETIVKMIMIGRFPSAKGSRDKRKSGHTGNEPAFLNGSKSTTPCTTAFTKRADRRKANAAKPWTECGEHRAQSSRAAEQPRRHLNIERQTMKVSVKQVQSRNHRIHVNKQARTKSQVKACTQSSKQAMGSEVNEDWSSQRGQTQSDRVRSGTGNAESWRDLIPREPSRGSPIRGYRSEDV